MDNSPVQHREFVDGVASLKKDVSSSTSEKELTSA